MPTCKSAHLQFCVPRSQSTPEPGDLICIPVAGGSDWMTFGVVVAVVLVRVYDWQPVGRDADEDVKLVTVRLDEAITEPVLL